MLTNPLSPADIAMITRVVGASLPVKPFSAKLTEADMERHQQLQYFIDNYWTWGDEVDEEIRKKDTEFLIEAFQLIQGNLLHDLSVGDHLLDQLHRRES